MNDRLTDEELDELAEQHYGDRPPSPLDPLLETLDRLPGARRRLRAAMDDLHDAYERLLLAVQ